MEREHDRVNIEVESQTKEVVKRQRHKQQPINANKLPTINGKYKQKGNILELIDVESLTAEVVREAAVKTIYFFFCASPVIKSESLSYKQQRQ